MIINDLTITRKKCEGVRSDGPPNRLLLFFLSINRRKRLRLDGSCLYDISLFFFSCGPFGFEASTLPLTSFTLGIHRSRKKKLKLGTKAR